MPDRSDFEVHCFLNSIDWVHALAMDILGSENLIVVF